MQIIYMESSLINMHNNGIDVNVLLSDAELKLKETKTGVKYFIKEEL